MSGSVNKVILIGNLGKDPDVRHLENGATVANFPIATSENYKDRKTGEKVSQTEWHNIVVWRGLADITERYLKKGDKVYIEGKLRTRSWQDQDGNTKYTTEVVADNLTMLGKSPDNSTSPPSQPASATSSTTQNEDFSGPDDSDDLPF
ncbi:MAG: single-stranded DNA-binding protein [Bacteroidota bacterium]|nr:single-stranded DNA-binding protein [Bacteroidota bacterium]MEC7936906.1 single-stranded DNA-binding protein [Bacteroidota bacterium]